MAVAGYPDVIVLLDVLRILHVVADEHLADVENRFLACALLYDMHELTDALHEDVVTTDFLNLCVGRFYVEHGRQVIRTNGRLSEEVTCLISSTGLHGEEMIGADLDILATRLQVVGLEVTVVPSVAFR